MANTIRLKRGTTTPAAGSLVTGELAINTSTGAVFTKTDGGSVVNIAGSATASWGGISGTLSSQTDLNSALSGKAASVHTHAIADVTNLQTSLDAKAALAGATFTGKIITPATTLTSAFFNLPHGSQPNTPVDGDLWTTTFDLGCRINGSNRYFAQKNNFNSYSAGNKQTVQHSAGTAGLNIAPAAGDPNVPADGDIWLNSTTNTLKARVNGVPEQLNAVKAWVNFNGTVNSTWAGGTSTVSRTAGSTTATITTTTAHGLTSGNVVYALTGVVAGSYTVTVLTSTTFTITTVATTVLTAASITFAVNAIRASYNVSSITDNGVGTYAINFTNALSDTNYSIVGSCINPGTSYGFCSTQTSTTTTSAVYTFSSATPNTVTDMSQIFVAILR